MIDPNLSALSVETYSSYAYAVEPRAFVADGERHAVDAVIRTWRTPGEIHFYVRDERAEFFELSYIEARDAWTLRAFCKTCPAL